MPSPGRLLSTYLYDPLDRLVGTHALLTTQRFYNRERFTTERQGLVSHCVLQYGNQLLAEKQFQGQTALLATDLQRSVLHSMSTTGPRARAYSAYGHHRAESGLGSLLGFNGEQPDRITGHYLLGNGHRAYNPVSMRFNSPDQLSPFGKGGFNAYAYCAGDPVNKVDPSGRLPISNLITLITGSINLVSQVVTTMPTMPFRQAWLQAKNGVMTLDAGLRLAATAGSLISTSAIVARASIINPTGMVSTALLATSVTATSLATIANGALVVRSIVRRRAIRLADSASTPSSVQVISHIPNDFRSTPV